MMGSDIQIEIDGNFILFKRDDLVFYDPEISRLDIEFMRHKQWFTSEVESSLMNTLEKLQLEGVKYAA